MSDMHVQLEKQRVEAANSAPIGKLVTEAVKRELFAKLAQHYNVLAAEVQKAIVQTCSPGPDHTDDNCVRKLGQPLAPIRLWAPDHLKAQSPERLANPAVALE